MEVKKKSQFLPNCIISHRVINVYKVEQLLMRVALNTQPAPLVSEYWLGATLFSIIRNDSFFCEDSTRSIGALLIKRPNDITMRSTSPTRLDEPASRAGKDPHARADALVGLEASRHMMS